MEATSKGKADVLTFNFEQSNTKGAHLQKAFHAGFMLSPEPAK